MIKRVNKSVLFFLSYMLDRQKEILGTFVTKPKDNPRYVFCKLVFLAKAFVVDIFVLLLNGTRTCVLKQWKHTHS